MTVLPIAYNSTAKSVSTENPLLSTDVGQLNALYAALLETNADTPPPPSAETFTKERSFEIKRLHETGHGLLRQNRSKEAAVAFTRGLALASARSPLEPFQGALPEMLVCLMGRCDASMASKDYQAALQDAEVLVLLGPTLADNHLRYGSALLHCGLAREAVAAFQRGVAVKQDHPLLRGALARASVLLQLENGDL